MAITLHPSFAVHPGTWLRAEIVEPHGLSVTVAAVRPQPRGFQLLRAQLKDITHGGGTIIALCVGGHQVSNRRIAVSHNDEVQ